MNVADAVETRLEVRDYAAESVDEEIKNAVLDTARAEREEYAALALPPDDFETVQLGSCVYTILETIFHSCCCSRKQKDCQNGEKWFPH